MKINSMLIVHKDGGKQKKKAVIKISELCVPVSL
jgi:hypothetical protein